MKSLVIYFSRADENYGVDYTDKGNTEIIAEYIQELTGADLFKVERKKPYPKDYKSCTDEAKREKENNERPELKNYLDNIDEYNTIYIGSPIYWHTMPQPMFTQLEKLNWQGKTVRVFTTHEGSFLADVPLDVQKICEGAKVLPNSLAVFGHDCKTAKHEVEKWLKDRWDYDN